MRIFQNSLSIIIMSSLALYSCKDKPKESMQRELPPAPTVAKKPKEFTEFGNKRIDNYFWLREKENPDVIKYLTAENTYSDTVLAHTKDLQKKLYEEMKGRIKEDDQSVPVLENGYYYYSRIASGQQYYTHCRKKGDLNAKEEILLDENKMAEGKPYFDLGGTEVTIDNKILAYSFNYTGSYVEYDLQFKELSTGKELTDVIKNCSGFTLANDNKTVFYTLPDKALRSYRLYKHILGTPLEKDVLIYEEKDALFGLRIGKTKTNDFVLLYIVSSTTSEVRLIDANKPESPVKIFQPRVKDTEYSLDHHKDKFFVRVKDKSHINYHLMEAPLKGYEDKNTWKEVIAHDPKVKIESIEVFDKYLAVTVRTNGLLEIRVITLADGKTSNISFPEPVYTVSSSYTPEYASPTLRYVYNSLNRPSTTYEYDMASGKSKVLKVREIPSGFNPDDYEVKRLFAKATDGTLIPMSIVYKKGIKLDGTNPTLLYAYGSYGYSMNAGFSSNVYSLIDRGFIYAIAHIRGGGDMGEEWYENGKLLKKKNTFTDFINSAEYLIQEKYTSPEHLAIDGGSAGGLLMGAVTNMRPDLFKAVVAEVPFVDVINTMLDESLPLTVGEYEEWGNPHEKEFYEYMITYSPYDNVTAKNYPNILATAGLNDSQVSYFEPAKWVAKLRELKTDKNILLLKTNMGAGHGGASGRFDYLKEEAFQYAFMIDMLGVSEK